jgi:hypothetical protein
MGADKNLPSSEAFSKALARYEPISQRHAAILKSWREHPSKDDLWRALERAAVRHGATTPQPADFIGVVLSCTMPAKRLNDHSEYVAKQFEKLKHEISAVVQDAIRPLDLWRDLQRFEEALRQLDRSDYPTAQPAGGRKDPNNSRDRRLFTERMFKYVHMSCGQYLPKEVAVMVDILFPGPEDIERTVRSWLPKSPKRVV